LRAGERVFIVSLNQEGIVQAPPEGRGEVELQVGAAKLRVPLGDVRRRALPERAASAPAEAAGVGLEKAMAVAASVDLRGLRAEEALEQLDKYLDDATLAGLTQVTVIHGKGTGALRQAVHDHLAQHLEVESFRLGRESEGGSGATIVTLGRR
jgi:DNA mismatch repair protein MutS2